VLPNAGAPPNVAPPPKDVLPVELEPKVDCVVGEFPMKPVPNPLEKAPVVVWEVACEELKRLADDDDDDGEPNKPPVESPVKEELEGTEPNGFLLGSLVGLPPSPNPPNAMPEELEATC